MIPLLHQLVMLLSSHLTMNPRISLLSMYLQLRGAGAASCNFELENDVMTKCGQVPMWDWSLHACECVITLSQSISSILIVANFDFYVCMNIMAPIAFNHLSQLTIQNKYLIIPLYQYTMSCLCAMFFNNHDYFNEPVWPCIMPCYCENSSRWNFWSQCPDQTR